METLPTGHVTIENHAPGTSTPCLLSPSMLILFDTLSLLSLLSSHVLSLTPASSLTDSAAIPPAVTYLPLPFEQIPRPQSVMAPMILSPDKVVQPFS